MAEKMVFSLFDGPQEELLVRFQDYKRGEARKAGGKAPKGSLAAAPSLTVVKADGLYNIQSAKKIIRARTAVNGPAIAVRTAVHDPKLSRQRPMWLLGAKVDNEAYENAEVELAKVFRSAVEAEA